jgi:enamine deaminase RidA (YjgF/YER057c/UK114 family)
MSADRRLISSGSPFEKQAGYSRAVAVGPWCFVAGTTGYDYATMSLPESVEAQTENVFATIERALGEAGFAMSDLVRVNYIVSDRAHQDAVFAVTGPLLGTIRPAATMIVAGLIRPEIKIEIEATAYRP